MNSSSSRGRQPESDSVLILAAENSVRLVLALDYTRLNTWPQLFPLLSLPFLNEKERSRSSETLCCSKVDHFKSTCYPRVGNAALEARFRRADC